MEKKLNYPIKYAALELKVPSGWEDNYEPKTIGYIVSKCYLVHETIIYKEDGTSEVAYGVVFPYNDFYWFQNAYLKKREYHAEPSIPLYCVMGGVYKCQNTNIVNSVFNTPEEASEATAIANHELKRSVVVKTGVDNYDTALEKITKNIELCKLYEHFINDNTSEMIVTGVDLEPRALKKVKPE